jgi:hypothetical protein
MAAKLRGQEDTGRDKVFQIVKRSLQLSAENIQHMKT